MPGPFDPVPFSTYQGAGAGAAQGLSALAQAFLARRQLGLQQQEFQMKQAQAGYVPAHQEPVGQPGVQAVGNVPYTNPTASDLMPRSAPTVMGYKPPVSTAPISGTGMGQGGPAPVLSTAMRNVPGHYDPYQSIAYLTSFARVLGEQNRGLEAEKVRAGSNQQINTDKLNAVGTWGVGPNGQPMFIPGTTTEGKIAAQQPMLDFRAGAQNDLNAYRDQRLSQIQQQLNDMNQYRQNMGNLGWFNAGNRQMNAQQSLALKAQAEKRLEGAGTLTPEESRAMMQAYQSSSYLGDDPATSESKAVQALDFYRKMNPRTPKPTQTPLPPLFPQSAPPSFLNLNPPAATGGATAPYVPRGGPEASNLTPQSAHGGNAPRVPLGNRHVPDTSTRTYPHAQNLPKSPSADTVATQPGGAGKVGKADIDAAYQRALQAGWSPADAAAKRDSLYQANGITP